MYHTYENAAIPQCLSLSLSLSQRFKMYLSLLERDTERQRDGDTKRQKGKETERQEDRDTERQGDSEREITHTIQQHNI